MSLFITQYKKQINTFLQDFLETQKQELQLINVWAEGAITRLSEFSTNGKAIRGSLVLFAFEAHGKQIDTDALRVAAAMELFHSGFLIHDDIMDKDVTRRGNPSIYAQYETLANLAGAREIAHFGLSMGINVGDLCFFLAHRVLSGISSQQLPAILSYINKELSTVVIAQMQDVSEGHMTKKLTQEEILSVYRYKTARYTFSLPLSLGSMLSGGTPHDKTQLIELGEALGILFQIRDDELSISGDETITGKPVGSDERNQKQILALRMNQADVIALQNQLLKKIDAIIEALPFTSISKDRLKELVVFCQQRKA
jgi:geranylgeranyl diphosphate synthase, type I